MKPSFFRHCTLLALAGLFFSFTGIMSLAADADTLVIPGTDGPGKGKKIVFFTGDEEYRSEEALSMLAKILSRHFGFESTVLFAIDPENGFINPNYVKNVPGTEALDDADLLVILARFRNLSPEQMAPITKYLNAGKPVLGLRTATHAFAGEGMTVGDWDYGDWKNGGFGFKVFGETWVSHHGAHKKEGTRGVIEPDNASHPILRGVKDIFAPTDVYTIKSLGPADTVLVRGQVTETLDPSSGPVAGEKNEPPLQPTAWLHEYTAPNGTTKGQSFCSTTGAGIDLVNEDLRRLIVNAALYLTGVEVPEKADVSYVDAYEPSFYGFAKDPNFWLDRKLKPADFGLGKAIRPVDQPGSPEWPFRSGKNK